MTVPETRDRRIDICPIVGKHTFLSEATANRACFDGMRPYKCEHFPHWHIGHSRKAKQIYKSYV